MNNGPVAAFLRDFAAGIRFAGSVTQATLQLEVARQYPDINLGSAYAYEEGSNFISLGLSAVLPLRSRNEGPIAEAEAQRKVAGAQLLAVQSTVIADADRALAQYTGTYAALSEASRSVNQLREQQEAIRRMLRAGEIEQLPVITAVASSSGSAPARRSARAKVLVPRYMATELRFSAKASAPQTIAPTLAKSRKPRRTAVMVEGPASSGA